ncbi:hypothetical protein PIB30_024048 [Stylosanthes scabra]|uniref:C2H2-type domain-containing protein n=1 Tax=Stylosanthes scabra TaxID=79078 RepID=A0ABU6R9V1_9FABA|nr:hypothetical protein [Stylosanthes scabra]
MDHQGQCLMMWTKRKYSTIPRTNNNTTYLSSSSFAAAASCYEVEESWEEKAFAKDAAGYIWPPRSYSCSFCRREFRSAQALGGHMNVHRRDRARLKQHQPSSPTINHDQEIIDDYDVLQPHNQHHPGQNNSNFDYLYNNPNCYYYGLNPIKYGSSSVSNSKLFKEGKTVIPLLNSSIFHGCLKRRSSSSNSNSKSIIVPPHHHNLETLCDEEEKSDDDDDVGVRLSLFVHRAKEEEDIITSFKKRKTDDDSSIPKSTSSVDVNHEFSPNFSEEMDLELRLGYSSSQVYSSK